MSGIVHIHTRWMHEECKLLFVVCCCLLLLFGWGLDGGMGHEEGVGGRGRGDIMVAHSATNYMMEWNSLVINAGAFRLPGLNILFYCVLSFTPSFALPFSLAPSLLTFFPRFLPSIPPLFTFIFLRSLLSHSLPFSISPFFNHSFSFSIPYPFHRLLVPEISLIFLSFFFALFFSFLFFFSFLCVFFLPFSFSVPHTFHDDHRDLGF